MARTLTAGMISEVAKATVRPALLAFFDFASGAVRVWTGTRDVSFGGNTFTGLGDLVQVSPIQEVRGTRPNGLTFTLNGVPSASITIALADAYRGRTCTLWLGFIDSSEALIADPVQIFSGRMDVLKISDTGDTSSITVQAESRFIELERSRELRYTDQTQRQLFAGDLGLEFVAALQDAEIPWGQQGKTTPGGVGGGNAGGGVVSDEY